MLDIVLTSKLAELHNTVTKKKSTEMNKEALIEGIIMDTTNAEELLKRKNVTGKVMAAYLHKEGIIFQPSWMDYLKSKILKHWAPNAMVDDMQPVTTDATVDNSNVQKTEDDVTSTIALPPESASSHPSPVAANKPDTAQDAKEKSKDKGSAYLETFGREVVSAIKQIKDPETQKSLQDIILMIIHSANEAEQRAPLHQVPQSTE